MSYRFQNRLRHADDRMAEVNTEAVTYIAIRSGKTIERAINASPILVAPDEIMDADPAATRVERQDWGIDVTQSTFSDLHPPIPGDKIRRQNREEYAANSMGRDEPPYIHTTSSRTRILLHTVRQKAPSQWGS